MLAAKSLATTTTRNARANVRRRTSSTPRNSRRSYRSNGGALNAQCCSILAMFDFKKQRFEPASFETTVREHSARMRTRGPDGSGYHGGDHFALAHERLAIMDPEGGKQPIVYETTGNAVVANGEMYNFRALQKEHSLPPSLTGSDSEVVLQLYEKFGPAGVADKLNGIFAFVVANKDGTDCLAARDHCGIKPLYMGKTDAGDVWFASELKAISDICDEVTEFPAGHYWTPATGLVKYYSPSWDSDDARPSNDTSNVRAVLQEAVREQCMSDVPFGLLLSGGLDSAVVGTLLKPIVEEMDMPFWSFTVGQEGSPDITAARIMSEHLGTVHHEYQFTTEEAFAAIPKIIYHLETYEPELIRSAIPNFFLAKLTSSKVKMVLTGEGSDELFGGYLYFRDAPDTQAFHKELRRIFHHLHNVNCQRADRMTMAWGLEGRVPFLDRNVIEEVMNVDPSYKMISGLGVPNADGTGRPEKCALRELFNGEIPESVLWRTKAMQCEGVGMDWVSNLQALCAEQVSDEEMAAAETTYPINPPHSKEELFYRRLFEEHYHGMDKFVHVWEGGCRAGGAPWENEAYTRAGLKNTAQLARGLGILDEDAVAA